MEVTQPLIGIGLVATLLIASSSAQIIVQPGYSHPSSSHAASPINQSPVTYQQSSRSLADEYQRNQALQQMIENQLHQIVNHQQGQQVRQMPSGMVGLPLIHLPLRPRIGGGRLFSLSPTGIRGVHVGGFGVRRPPFLLREAAGPYMQANYAAKTQWPRSVFGGPGDNFGGDSEVHDVASEPSVEGGSVNGVDDLPVAQALVADDFNDKLVEPRHTGQSDDAIVGGPLDRIYYDQSYNHDQHHPMDSSALSSQFMKTAHAIGQMIDKVAPGLMDSETAYDNKDPMSSMTNHQDPVGNYHQYSQYYQPFSHQGKSNESPRNWNVASTSLNNQPMPGQSYNSQELQNSEVSSISTAQGSQKSSAKASDNERYSQEAPTSYPDTNSPVNWLTAAKHIFSGQPGYQNYRQPGYNKYQPGYQTYETRPKTGGYQPNAYGYFTTASSSPNNYNYYNPYHRSSYNNPHASYSPYSFSGAVDQFGRAVLSQLPSAVNSFISNPSNIEYLKNTVGRQIPEIFKQSYGY